MKLEIGQKLDENFQIQQWWRYMRQGGNGRQQEFSFHAKASTSPQLQSVAVLVLVDIRNPEQGILLSSDHSVDLAPEPKSE